MTRHQRTPAQRRLARPRAFTYIDLIVLICCLGLGILVGAELNAEIEHAMPYSVAPLTDSETGRRVIGARAARLFDRLKTAAAAPAPAVPVARDEGRTRWSVLPGLAFTATVLGLRGPKRVLGGPT